MRTDSVNLSEEAIRAARRRIRDLYGEEFLSPQPRRYQTKTANAQEAHEAIRPAGDQMRPADSLPLDGREKALYDLIWKRTIASQMANARLKLTTATIAVEDALFRASGRTVLFPGFFRAYVEGSDDPDAELESQDTPLPPLAVGEGVDVRELEPVGHETKPPGRYTEATLVKALEAEGIGRPSTYASIIDTIQERGYVFKQRKELVPTFTAFAVTELLEQHFDELVDLKFTANMEQRLDDISNGSTDHLAYLRQFYLGAEGLETHVRTREAEIDPRQASSVNLINLNAEVRIGQYGPYVAKEEGGERLTVGLPADLPPADLTDELVEDLLHHKLGGPQTLGIEPESGLPVLLKKGPFGPYVQLGEDDPTSKAKPKRASLLKGMAAESLALDVALQLLSLPRTLGPHPETGKPVQAGVGRFGPFVVCDGVYANLKGGDNVLEIDLDRALDLLAAKLNGGAGGRRSADEERPQGAGRTPGGGRGAGAGWPVWTLCQSRQGKRDAAQGRQAGRGDPGTRLEPAGGQETGQGAGQDGQTRHRAGYRSNQDLVSEGTGKTTAKTTAKTAAKTTAKSTAKTTAKSTAKSRPSPRPSYYEVRSQANDRLQEEPQLVEQFPVASVADPVGHRTSPALSPNVGELPRSEVPGTRSADTQGAAKEKTSVAEVSGRIRQRLRGARPRHFRSKRRASQESCRRSLPKLRNPP